MSEPQVFVLRNATDTRAAYYLNAGEAVSRDGWVRDLNTQVRVPFSTHERPAPTAHACDKEFAWGGGGPGADSGGAAGEATYAAMQASEVSAEPTT